MEALADVSGTQWLTGHLAAALAAAAAYGLRALTVSGAIAAAAVGGTIVGAAGWWPGFVLVAFFTTSSALSMYAAARTAVDEQARGKRRDATQVLANGGVPAICAVASAVADSGGPWLVALAAAVAGAASDTWGTEIGRFSRNWPRVITTWKAVAPGTSGAVSGLGTLGSFSGALLIALVAGAGQARGWAVPGSSPLGLIAIVTVAGIAGSIVDSLLGATIQARYRCPTCNQMTEHHIHWCGAPTVFDGGVRWMSNDTVNLLAIAVSAGLGLGLGSI